jgi:hypothetical protein
MSHQPEKGAPSVTTRSHERSRIEKPWIFLTPASQIFLSVSHGSPADVTAATPQGKGGRETTTTTFS